MTHNFNLMNQVYRK